MLKRDGGGGGTSSFGLYREAPPKRVSCTFFRFQVYERVGKSVISAGKDPKGQITNAIKDLEEVEETFRFQYKCGIFIVKI